MTFSPGIEFIAAEGLRCRRVRRLAIREAVYAGAVIARLTEGAGFHPVGIVRGRAVAAESRKFRRAGDSDPPTRHFADAFPWRHIDYQWKATPSPMLQSNSASWKSSTLDKISITGFQCRAARGLIGMDQNTLAAEASIARGTLIDFEKGKRLPSTNNVDAIARALQSAGVEFIAENGGGPGVRLRK